MKATLARQMRGRFSGKAALVWENRSRIGEDSENPGEPGKRGKEIHCRDRSLKSHTNLDDRPYFRPLYTISLRDQSRDS